MRPEKRREPLERSGALLRKITGRGEQYFREEEHIVEQP